MAHIGAGGRGLNLSSTSSSENGKPLAAFEELAMPHFNSLYNFARWLTHNGAEAEDLVQEAFAKALKGFGGFQQGTNFRAWMFRILRNTFLTSRSGLAATRTVSLDTEGKARLCRCPARRPNPSC